MRKSKRERERDKELTTHPASRRRGVADHLARREVWTFLGLGAEVEEAIIPRRRRSRSRTLYSDLIRIVLNVLKLS